MDGGKRNAFRRMLRRLDLPEEADLRVPKVTMLGDSDLLVENHTGILQYGPETVRLTTRDGTVNIDGKELELTEFGSERVLVRGRILGWRFEV